MNIINVWYFAVASLVLNVIEINGNVCYKVNEVVTTNFCSGTGKSVHVGDFDGNGKDDFVCHDSKTGSNVIYYAPRKPFEPLSSKMRDKWCYGANSRFLVGDFNGDGRSDFLCHLTSNGYKWVALADKDGQFTGTSWSKGMGWCRHSGSEVHVGDFNGDRRDDILCHDTSGNKWIAYANSKGQFTQSWYRRLSKCNGKLHTGDFNGDKKTDILCHEKGTGTKYIWVAGASNNVFTNLKWKGQGGWCTHGGSFLRIGDINGDGRDDLICKDNSAKGNIWYSKNIGKPNFKSTTFYSTFCRSSNPLNFHLADVTGDKKKDLLCINKIGHAQIGVSTCR